jgi:uncharacterized membrane protein
MTRPSGDAMSARPALLRTLARWVLGWFLIAAGIGHFLAPEAFLAQTPTWLPARSAIVVVSGIVEVVLGVALLLVRTHRRTLGWSVAAFFVLVLPGNVHQAVTGTPAFGLDTPTARWARLAFQPLLVLWALWATGVLGGRATDDGSTRAEGPGHDGERPTDRTSDPDLRP